MNNEQLAMKNNVVYEKAYVFAIRIVKCVYWIREYKKNSSWANSFYVPEHLLVRMYQKQ